MSTSQRSDKFTIVIKKYFKHLEEKREISIEIGKLAKDRNKKDVSVFMDHINLLKNLINIQIESGITHRVKRIKTKKKNVDLDTKYPEITIKNITKNNIDEDSIDKNINKNGIINPNRVGIALIKKK